MTSSKKIAVSLWCIGMLSGCAVDAGDGGGVDTPGRANVLDDVDLIVEAGAWTSPHALRLDPMSDPASTITLRLVSASTGQSTTLPAILTASGDHLRLPSFRPPDGEGLVARLELYADGSFHGAIDVHAAEALPAIPPAMSDTVLDRGERSLLLNLARVEDRKAEHVYGRVSLDPRGPSDLIVDAQVAALTLCGNGFAGPGIGYFESASPGSGGQGFSFLPEWGGGSLFWAIHGELAVDSIYRSSWGCGTAYKVPNNCTVAVSATGSMSYCCGAPWLTPSWQDTYASPYWPDCPRF